MFSFIVLSVENLDTNFWGCINTFLLVMKNFRIFKKNNISCSYI